MTETQPPEVIKVSKRPLIQKRVEEIKDELTKRFPTAEPPLLNQYARDKVAGEVRRERLREEEKRGSIDHVTDLPLRRVFERRLKEEIKRSIRFGHPLTMVLVDLNRLKEINTNGGYPAGDEALRLVGQKLKESSREIDFVARYGGDEFAVLLVETPLSNIDGWWERFQEEINKLPFTVSAGATEVNLKDPAKTPKILSNLVKQAKEMGNRQTNELIRHSPD